MTFRRRLRVYLCAYLGLHRYGEWRPSIHRGRRDGIPFQVHGRLRECIHCTWQQFQRV